MVRIFLAVKSFVARVDGDHVTNIPYRVTIQLSYARVCNVLTAVRRTHASVHHVVYLSVLQICTYA